MRKIVGIGWDGRSNLIYRFQDELHLAGHMQTRPTVREIVEQYPHATWTSVTFERIRLIDIAHDSVPALA